MKSQKTKSHPQSSRPTMKGRITRLDQAWEAALREAIQRGRVHDIDEAHDEALSMIASVGNVAIGLPATIEPQGITTAGPLPTPQPIVVPLKYVSGALLACAKHDIRYYLNGIFLHSVDGEIRICGTDGHRLIVSRFVLDEGVQLPAWTEAGIIIPREELVQALPVLQKNSTMSPTDCSEPAIVIEYGEGFPNLTLRAVNGFASFTMKPIDGKFPDYAKVMGGAAATLARGDMEAMKASAIDTRYIKGAADIAAKLGAKSIRSFIGCADDATAFFTFEGAPDTVLIVMPIRGSSEAVSDGAVKLLGERGVSASISAFRAHVTRCVKALGQAKGEERKEIEAKKEGFEAKIARLLGLTNPGNQLTNKSA